VHLLQNADWPALCLAVLAVLFIGISKAGFGGALGLLSTPLCVLAFGPRDAIGILLPLLCAGDAFSLGVWLGVRLNRRFSEASFLWIIYLITFLAGLHLIFDFDFRNSDQ
jgi:uncharacterized membrane protein YfcA